ncbi:MAG: hypothetical protein ACRC18_04980, partial [Cetobacterium sp.]
MNTLINSKLFATNYGNINKDNMISNINIDFINLLSKNLDIDVKVDEDINNASGEEIDENEILNEFIIYFNLLKDNFIENNKNTKENINNLINSTDIFSTNEIEINQSNIKDFINFIDKLFFKKSEISENTNVTNKINNTNIKDNLIEKDENTKENINSWINSTHILSTSEIEINQYNIKDFISFIDKLFFKKSVISENTNFTDKINNTNLEKINNYLNIIYQTLKKDIKLEINSNEINETILKNFIKDIDTFSNS